MLGRFDVGLLGFLFFQKPILFAPSLGLVVCGFLTIFSSHLIFSLLFLISSFFFSCCILLLLECELLAFLFLTVYIGAIAILFLFAVMMLDFKRFNIQKSIIAYVPAGFFVGASLLFLLITEINNFFVLLPKNHLYFNTYINWFDLIQSATETEALGYVLYSYFVLHFLVAGLILVIVLFGVVRLTNVPDTKKSNKGKQQVLFKQLSKQALTFNSI